MAITFVDSTTFTVAAGTGTVNIALPVSLQNDIVLICLAVDDIATTNGVQGQGYTNINGPTGTTPGRQICYKRMGATPDTSVDVSQEDLKIIAGLVQIWRGVSTSTAEDATATSASGNNTTPDSPAIVTATNDALVLSIMHLDDDDTTPSVFPSGYTNTLSKNTGQASTTVGATVAIASKIIATAGSENPGAYTTSSDQWFAFSVALKPAGAIVSGPHAGTSTGVGTEFFTDLLGVSAATTVGTGTHNFQAQPGVFAATAVGVAAATAAIIFIVNAAATALGIGTYILTTNIIRAVSAVGVGTGTFTTNIFRDIAAIGVGTRTITTNIVREATAVASNLGEILAAISRTATAVGTATLNAVSTLLVRTGTAIGLGSYDSVYIPGAPSSYTGDMWNDRDYERCWREATDANVNIGELPSAANAEDFRDWLNMAWKRVSQGRCQYWTNP